MNNQHIDQADQAAQKLQTLSSYLGYQNQELGNLRHALTHGSAKNQERPSNERLEFFGDAVVGLVATELLYHAYPDHPEGELTRMRASLVSRQTLAQKAREIQLHNHAFIGKGAGKRKELPTSVLANIFEAVVAALYLDLGYQHCFNFLKKCFEQDLKALLQPNYARNYKSSLQHVAQAQLNTIPRYNLNAESGPDHKKNFFVSVMLKEEVFGKGSGKSKKEAEQMAARSALKRLLAETEYDDALIIELPEEEDDV